MTHLSEMCLVITTHNYLTLYPEIQTTHTVEIKHYSHLRKHSVKLCSMGSKILCSPLAGGKTTNHNQELSIRRSNEYIISKKICQVWRVSEHWCPSLPTIGNWWDPEGSKPRSCLNDKTTNLLTKEGLLSASRKPDNIANKSNDDRWRGARWTITGRTPNFDAFAWTKPPNIINNTQNSP